MNTIRTIMALVAICATLSASAVTTVKPGVDLVRSAVAQANAGDVIELEDGQHIFKQGIQITKDLTIRAAKDAKPVIIVDGTETATYRAFLISATCDVKFEGISFEGKPLQENGTPSTYAICVHGKDINGASLRINNCTFTNYNYKAGSPIRCFYGSLLRELDIRNSTFKNCDRGINCVVYTPKEKTHDYAVERINLYNCLFVECATYAVGFHSLTEDLADVSLIVNHCVFDKCNINPRTYNIQTRNIRNIKVSNSIFCNQEGLVMRLSDSNHTITNCCIESPLKILGTTIGNANEITKRSPKFIEGTYKLDASSPLLNAATDGKNIGLVW